MIGVKDPALTTSTEGTLPIISILRPLKTFADHAKFSHIISYGMQDAVSSCHIVIAKGSPAAAEFSYAMPESEDIATRRRLMDTEGQSIITDLSRILEAARL